MKNNRVAFQIYNGDPANLQGYKVFGAHPIIDIKLGDNFRRKARCAGDVHRPATATSVIYSIIVSRDSVRIGLLIIALNELDIKCADIQHSYLIAPCTEQLYTWARPEFGIDKCKPFIIVRALYGPQVLARVSELS